MEDLIAQLQHHAQNSLGYWGLIRLARLALTVSRLEREQRRIIVHLNRTYQDSKDG